MDSHSKHARDLLANYLERLRAAWDGPDDFWAEPYFLSYDSSLLKKLISDAFLEGYTEALCKLEKQNNE
jgi:hypothetical protein